MEIALLDNKKSIKNLVEVDIHDSILESINKELAKDEYNFVVTADDVPKAKNLLADLNKSKDAIDTFRKTKVASESLNIDLLKDNCKIYIDLFDAKREEIKKKFEVFEKEKKDKIAKELSLYADKAVKDANLRYDFSKVDTADLIKLGSANPSGSLKKATTETIDGRVLACKSKQDKYDMRLKDLEIECRRAGLEAIMTITHVQGIISLDSDAEYQTRLNELIAHEIERQNMIKANLQRQLDGEAQQKVINEQNRIRGIFTFSLGSLEDTDSALANLSLIKDFSEYGDYGDFARSFVGEQISKLNFHRNDLLKKANDLLAEMEKKEIPIVHETIPSTQEEKQDQAKEVAANVEVGKKVVLIDVHLQFKVKDTIPNDKIIAKVNQMLKEAGFDESLIGVEVVQ